MTKDGDLLLAKVREQQAKDQLERILNLFDLIKCYSMPQYQPDIIDLEGYERVSRN